MKISNENFQNASDHFSLAIKELIDDLLAKNDLGLKDNPDAAYVLLNPMILAIIDTSLTCGISFREILRRFSCICKLFLMDFGLQEHEFIDKIADTAVSCYTKDLGLSKKEILARISRIYDVCEKRN